MPEKIKQKKSVTTNELPLKQYLETLPTPPQEHEYELKMEKFVNHLIKEKQKKIK